MFADDIKLYRVVNCIDDARLLQSDINLLFNWHEYNLLYAYGW